MTLKSELNMRKGFENPAHEALLNIYYSAARIRKKAGEFFRRYGLTDVQFNVLSLLRHQCGEVGGLTQVELSKMMLVNRANITTLIDRMEKAGLVLRKPAPDDRRFNIIELTPYGIEMYQKVREVYKRKIGEIMHVLNDDELESLKTILEKLRMSLDAIRMD